MDAAKFKESCGVLGFGVFSIPTISSHYSLKINYRANFYFKILLIDLIMG